MFRDMIRDPPKVVCLWVLYRVEKTRSLLHGLETRSLIDGMGTVRLAETNGHNESIEDH